MSLRNVLARSVQSILWAGRRKDGTVTGSRLNPDCRAASFQINATLRCRPFGLRCSVPSRTAVMKPSIVASLISSGSIPWALA